MKNITVIGGGVLGSQIAFQTAYSGLNVTISAMNEESKKQTEEKLSTLKETYINEVKQMSQKKDINKWCNGISSYEDFDEKKCLERIEKASKSIVIETNMKSAVKDADLIIESITEDFNIKKELYEKLSTIMPPKTIIVTNSSTLLPSRLAKYTGRSNMFLALHFANSIWKNNITEVMKHDKTEDKYFKEVMEFARSINMVPLPVEKEKSGYLLNSMLIPLLFSGLDLYVNGISDPESIDKAWTMGTGSPKGPFMILDTVGLTTAYEIVQMYVKIPSFLAPYNFKGMSKLLKKYIDEGKLGKSTNEGFYKYKNGVIVK